MSKSYYEAEAGLYKICIGQMGALVCTVLQKGLALHFLPAIAMFIFSIVVLVGLFQAGKEIKGCRVAFILSILEIMIRICTILFVRGKEESVTAFSTIMEILLAMLVICFVSFSVSRSMIELGRVKEAKWGKAVGIITATTYTLSMIIAVLSIAPSVRIVTVPTALIVGIVKMVSGILYFIFVYKSFHTLTLPPVINYNSRQSI